MFLWQNDKDLFSTDKQVEKTNLREGKKSAGSVSYCSPWGG